MTGKTLLICTPEKDYARRLAELIAGRKEYMFSVHFCDSAPAAYGLSQERDIDYLLIDSSFPEDERASFRAGRRFVLTAHPDEPAGEGERAVFKYRSGTAIIEQLAAECVDDRELVMRRRVSTARVVGFYSPVTRTGQTELAIETGRILAGGDSVLYLNLCPYARERLPECGEAGSIDDLIYFIRQDAPNISIRLGRMTGRLEGMDCLKPAAMLDDLMDVEEWEWLEMIDVLEARAGYGVIILDLSGCVRGITGILSRCSHVFMPVLDEPYCDQKTEAFLQELKREEKTGLIRTIRRVSMEEDTGRLAASCARTVENTGARGCEI